MGKWLLLLTLSTSMFIIVIDTTIMNVSISALITDLDTTVGGIQSAIALYALVMASFMLIGGKLADILGRRRTFMIGVSIFGVGTFVASISQNLATLLIGWSVLEGLGSALMIPNIQTLLRSGYDGKDRAFAYGIIGAVAAVGAAVGPIVGGYLTTFHTWRWAFRLEVLIVLLVLYLCQYVSKDQPSQFRPAFDFPGAILSVSGLSILVCGVLLSQQYGFWLAKQPLVIAGIEIAPLGLSVSPIMIGVGVLLVIGLLEWEQHLEEHGRAGLFKPSIFAIPGVRAALAVRFTQMAATTAFLFTMPLLFQLSFDYTAMQTGMALIPFSAALLVFAILGARLSTYMTAKQIIRIGFVGTIIGLILIAVTITPAAEPLDLATGVVFGAGLGLIASQILNLILSSVPAEDSAEASGLNGTFEQLGNAIGVALVGSIMLGTLGAGISADINASDLISDDAKTLVDQGIERSIQLVSDVQLSAALEELPSDRLRLALIELYALARTRAFQIGVWFIVFVLCVGLLITVRLSNKKLVE